MDTARDWIALSMAQGLGPSGFWRLVESVGSPAAVLDRKYNDLLRVSGLRKGQLEDLRQTARLREAAAIELEKLQELGGVPVIFEDPDYPGLLRKCINPPPLLYVKGNKSLLNNGAVAIVGSRAATGYGRRIAFNLGRDLAGNHITVVSGLATGIDTEAHCGCLAGSGTTIAVLGCGLDVVYPRSNKSLYSRIEEQGALVTEYCLGTKPEGFRFPARNRIIAGLCHGVVVVEAAKKSGSLITVGHALEEGREVFAVPGQVDSSKSSGTHWLLQQGASLAVCAADIIAGLGLTGNDAPVAPDRANANIELDTETAALFRMIDHYPKQRNELVERSGMNPGKISEHLLLLELDGLIEILPGDLIRRITA
ncbi:MAG: DNA-processing protein DprA [Desulfocapsaceae bacterium]|jgi:DNA processing protein|nr:DNA-processing protein DprA [Desulfocapsaceae bacterium]